MSAAQNRGKKRSLGRNPTSGWEGYIAWASIAFGIIFGAWMIWWGFS